MQTPQATPAAGRRPIAVRNLAYSALLAALSVVFARLVIPMPNAFTRFSIEAVPIFLAGVLFGPLAGGMVGFSADFIGCLFSGYGYNPLFCLPPILYGVCAGLFQPMLCKKASRFGCCWPSFPRWCSAPSCGKAPRCPSSTTAKAALKPAWPISSPPVRSSLPSRSPWMCSSFAFCFGAAFLSASAFGRPSEKAAGRFLSRKTPTERKPP